MTWEYYGGTGLLQQTRATKPSDGQPVETVGLAELEIMLRARESASGMLILEHTRRGDAKRLAARRLVIRELLAGPHAYGNRWVGWLYAYTLTERGRTCWLRCKRR